MTEPTVETSIPAAGPAVTRPPSMLAAFAGLVLVMSLFFPRFLVALPLLCCLGLCLASFVRKERWRPASIVIAMLAVGVLVLTEVPASSLAGPATVTYSVTGSASRAAITVQNASGGSEQMTVSLPWTETITTKSGEFVYISAQNQDDSGTVTCDITVNGQEFKTSTSSGAYTIADCSGSAP